MKSTILITGANRGIGLALVRRYLAQGCAVIATCRHPEKASALHALAKTNPALTIAALDVTSDASLAAFVAILGDQPVDILINNAGILSAANPKLTAQDSDPSQIIGGFQREGLQTMFATNSVAPAMITQALLPNLRKGKARKIAMISSSWGSIANMTDEVPLGYGASKAALNFITKSLSLALQSENFVVLTLNPGWVSSDMGGQGADWTPEESAARLAKVIDAATPEQSGQFIRHTGEQIPW